MRSWRNGPRAALWNSRTGSAGVEFALLAPVLVALLLGASEAFYLWQAGTKTIAAAAAVADLTAQAGQQTAASLDGIVGGARQILAPLPNALGQAQGQLSVSIASIGFDASGAPLLLWHYDAGGGAPLDIARAKGLGAAGDSVILASLVYRFSPRITAFGGAATYAETALTRPRLVAQTSYNGKVQW